MNAFDQFATLLSFPSNFWYWRNTHRKRIKQTPSLCDLCHLLFDDVAGISADSAFYK